MKSRRKRQYFMDYCNELVQCGAPTNCGQEAGCTVHPVHSNRCAGNNENNGCGEQQAPVAQNQVQQVQQNSFFINQSSFLQNVHYRNK
uniref:Uncharacterized protein n=1 Tax=Caenorhabditis japonica TaxID=281687 RepID=A0A8R1EGB9_CAEJA